MDVRNAVKQGLVIAVALVALAPVAAHAQVLSNIANVNMSATMNQYITVAVTSGSTVNFALAADGIAAGDVPAVVQTNWNLNPGLIGAVSLYGYFDTPAQALTQGGGDDIASSLVEGRVTTGTPTTFTAFTQTNPVGPAGGSLALFSTAIAGPNKVGTRTDNLDLQINLTGTTVPAGTYSGVLRLQARAI
jgi:hypothetical protein